MTLARELLEYLDKMICNTEVELYVRTKFYRNIINLISELPGITELSATLILSEIGADMSVFESAKHLASWAGLVPANNESAGKKKICSNFSCWTIPQTSFSAISSCSH